MRTAIFRLLLALAGIAPVFSIAAPERAGPLPSHHSELVRAGDPPLFNPAEFLEESTLDVTVLQDWHVDTVNGTTRQKLIEISVAEWWPGQDYRIPVRLIVPLQGKATGFHITGDHAYGSLAADAGLGYLDSQLIAGGVGVVYTVVRPLESLPGGVELVEEMRDRLHQTHDLRYSPFWIWPMTLMRATTAAYAETEYFNPGKVAGSGPSKNGYAPAAALINDQRFTATRSGVAPPYASPLRLYDQATVDEVMAANDWFFAALDGGQIDPGEHSRTWYAEHSFGAPGDFHVLALAAGWTWEEIRRVVEESKEYFYVSENWDQLMARDADVLFEPGTHDWVAYDILWGAENHPEIPVYNRANGGHEQTAHVAAETGGQNETVLLLRHFFAGPPLLEPPTSSYEIAGDELRVSVAFDNGPEAQSGRIWWMYDRSPGGSAPFLWERTPTTNGWTCRSTPRRACGGPPSSSIPRPPASSSSRTTVWSSTVARPTSRAHTREWTSPQSAALPSCER